MLPRLFRMQHQYKGDFIGDHLIGVGRVTRLPLCHLSLYLVTRIQPWLMQTVGPLFWTGRVWQDAPGCSQSPALCWPFCFHPCLGMSSLRMGGCFQGPLPALGERCSSSMGITRCFKCSFQISSLITEESLSFCCLQAPDASAAIKGVTQHCRIIYCSAGDTFPPCCCPQFLRLQNHV